MKIWIPKETIVHEVARTRPNHKGGRIVTLVFEDNSKPIIPGRYEVVSREPLFVAKKPKEGTHG